MIQATQGSLVMVGLNTPEAQVFWNGVKVEGIKGIAVANGAGLSRVTLTLPEDPILAEMQAAGIVIKRSAV